MTSQSPEMPKSYIMIDGYIIHGAAATVLSMQSLVSRAIQFVVDEGREDLWVPIRGNMDGVQTVSVVRLHRNSTVAAFAVADSEAAAEGIEEIDEAWELFQKRFALPEE